MPADHAVGSPVAIPVKILVMSNNNMNTCERPSFYVKGTRAPTRAPRVPLGDIAFKNLWTNLYQRSITNQNSIFPN